jgi:hypothetical protein
MMSEKLIAHPLTCKTPNDRFLFVTKRTPTSMGVRYWGAGRFETRRADWFFVLDEESDE